MPTQLTFDGSALARFWDVTGKLEAGTPVTEAEWQALFETAGYRSLPRDEFGPEALRPRFELAFGRGREADARAAAQSDERLAHYLMVREHRAPLQEFFRTLNPCAAFGEAQALAARWLPARFIGESPSPTLTALVFQATGTGDDPILWDALFAYYLGRNHLVLAAAHSLHHYYRSRFRRALPGLEPRLAGSVDLIQAEGMGDLINVERWMFQGGPIYSGGPLGNARWAARMREGLERAPAALEALDRLLLAAPADRQACESAYRVELVAGHHGPGFHMSRTIIQAGLEAEMVEGCADPVRFFDLYRKACQLAGVDCPVSEHALAVLAAAAQ